MKLPLQFFFGFMTVFLCACGPNVSTSAYDASEVGVAAHVVSGTILAKRMVKIDGNSGLGGLAGATAGGAAGSGLGNTAASNVVGAVGGAVVGGVVGNVMDQSFNQHRGIEYIVKLNNGKIISIVQSTDVELKLKQPVLIIYGVRTRIIPR